MKNNNPHYFYRQLRYDVGRFFSKGSHFIADSLLQVDQKLLSALPHIPSSCSSTDNKVLLCRHFFAPSYSSRHDLCISEEKFLLDDTLSEFSNSNPGYSFDSFFWDLEYSPFTSASNHFVSYVLSRNYEVVILGSWAPSSRCFWLPSPDSLLKLKKSGVKIIIIWFDSCSDLFVDTITNCLDLATLHVLADNPLLDFGNSSAARSLSSCPNIVSPCWPFSSSFLNPDLPKTIDFSFLGRVESYRSYRTTTLEYLISNNVPIYHNLSSSVLPWENYIRIMSSSKMTLNFSFSVSRHQLKGRALQAFWAKSLLFESSNAQITSFFEPYKHFIPYDSDADLLQKIRLYLDDVDSRIRITNAAYRIVKEKYNSCSFWSTLFSLV